MIRLSNVSKDYETNAGRRRVLKNINLTIGPGERIGIMGKNGAGKSTLVRLISGAELPTSGSIERNMSVSWPLAFTGGFHANLTGVDNVRFICRIMGSVLKIGSSSCARFRNWALFCTNRSAFIRRVCVRGSHSQFR